MSAYRNVMLLIADGDPSRHSRMSLTAKSMTCFGLSMRAHPQLDQVTLINVSECFNDGLFDPP